MATARERLEELRNKQDGVVETPRQKLERLRKEQGQTPLRPADYIDTIQTTLTGSSDRKRGAELQQFLTSMRLEPTAAPANSTGTTAALPADPVQAFSMSAGSGSIPEQPIADMRLDPMAAESSRALPTGDPGKTVGGEMLASEQAGLDERTLNMSEAFASVGSGFLAGMLDLEPNPAGSVVERALWQYRNQPSNKVASFLGLVSPYGAAAKSVRVVTAAPKIATVISKMPTIVKMMGESAATGAAVAAWRELSRAIQGRETDWSEVGTEAAFFAGTDLFLHGLGATGKQAARLFTDGKLKEADDLIRAALEDGRLSANPKETLNAFLYRGNRVLKDLPVLPQRFVTSLGGLNLSLENTIRTFDRLGVVAREAFYRKIKEAEHLALVGADADAKVLKGVVAGLNGQSKRNIYTYAVGQQKGGADILKEYGVAMPELTAQETQAYEHMRREFERYFGQINEVRRAAGIEPFGKQENYFTFFGNLDDALQNGHTILTIQPHHIKADAAPFAYAKTRSGNLKPLLTLDATQVFRKYSETAHYYIQTTPHLNRMRRLIDGEAASLQGAYQNPHNFVGKDHLKLPGNAAPKDLPRAVGGGVKFETLKDSTKPEWSFREANPEAYKFFDGWINAVAGQRYAVLPPQVDRALRRLNQNIAYSTLSFAFRSALIQPTAMVTTLAEIGPKWAFEGATAMMTGKYRFAMKNSNVLFGRQYETTVVDALEGLTGKWASKQRAVADVGMAGLRMFDQVTAAGTWYGAYQKAVKKYGLSHQRAVNFADDVVVRTQASAARSDIAPIQRETIGKTATMFNTFVINQWGWLRRDMLGIGAGKGMKAEHLMKTVGFLAGSQAVTLLFEDVMGTRSPYPAPVHAFKREMDKSDDTGRAMWASMMEMAEMVPVVGGATRYGSSVGGPTLEYANDVIKFLSGRTKQGPEIFELAGKTFGLPGTMEIKKKYKWITEEE